MTLTESTVEQAALAWFEANGWSVAHGVAIALGERLMPASGQELEGAQ